MATNSVDNLRRRTPDGTVLNSIPWPILALYFVARAPINLAVAIGRFQLPRFTNRTFSNDPNRVDTPQAPEYNKGRAKSRKHGGHTR